MGEPLLVTMRSEDACSTLSFDETAQSVLWIDSTGAAAAEYALACLACEGQRVVLRALHGAAILTSAQANPVRSVVIERGREGVYVISGNDAMMTLHVRAATRGMRTFRKVVFTRDVDFEIGRGRACEVGYDNPLVSMRHARVNVRDGRFSVTDLRSANGTYVNGARLVSHQPRSLSPGDVVEVLDLTFAAGKGFMCLNSPGEVIWRGIGGVNPFEHVTTALTRHEGFREAHEHALFYPAPRLTKSIHPLLVSVDDPPTPHGKEAQPAIMQIGPSFLMGLTSLFMGASSVARMIAGADFLSAAPSLAMAVAMVAGSVVWPLVSRSYTRKMGRRQEIVRKQSYLAYLDGIEDQIENEVSRQEQILRERRHSVVELLDWAHSLSPTLMNRTCAHDDFMQLRVGVGDCAAEVEVAWPQHHFTVDEDPLLLRATKVADEPPLLREVPLVVDLARHFVTGVIGGRVQVRDFVRGLIVQTCALYSYQEVKVVLIAEERERSEWDFVVSLGHGRGHDGNRLLALTYTGMVELDLFIEHELEGREKVHADVLGDYGTYYLFICASSTLAERSEAIARLLAARQNLGFSLVYVGSGLRDLPRECVYIIDLEGGRACGLDASVDQDARGSSARTACMFERSDVLGTLMWFEPDISLSAARARAFALDLARVHLDTPGRQNVLPDALGFLEMLELGSLSHLNVGQRWTDNDASRTLQAQVGVDAQGDPAVIDLHERIHGPHGLIAGTTGSGKSEFIITYILSLCVNYAPDEVAFVLIDYKGGGLAGAFDNERHHLPHLAGTITNLGGTAIHRSLVSIQSELQRRQRLFNEARDLTGEPTMDIYRYLSFYRQGLLTQALPHLFIIADEFAELKQQEPDFMAELVSAARIGRSLGIHLILATQKPSGVVDDQIWSNARLKVSLKVSDVADSREMIRREDAAQISRPGRYFMLVGYNESFASGQAAYAGGAYVPTERFEHRRDLAVRLIDAEGRLIAAQRPPAPATAHDVSELNAVLGVLEETARVTDKYARKLWLDPLPDCVTFDELIERYGEIREGGLVCVMGELDDPEHQEQRRFEVDLEQVGNVMLYGSQASDVDGLARAVLATIAARHGADDVWLYGVDLGAGELAALAGLPQVGGVVLAGDDERTENLFRMLEREVRRRRELGEGRDEDGEPAVVVALANLAAFYERFESLEDRLVSLTRDAPRYGIHFVVTAATANTPRLRLRANFGLSLPTVLNDPNDYGTIVGTLGSVVPPQLERRGLAREGKRLLEFQGICLCADRAAEPGWIERLACRAREDSSATAPSIPVLPKEVHAREMGTAPHALCVPVGFSKADVSPVYFDLERSRTMLVLGNDLDAIGMYLGGILDSVARGPGEAYRFVDPQQVLGDAQDELVLQSEDAVCSFVRALDEGSTSARVIVFTSIVQTMSTLPPGEANMLQSYLATERDAGQRYLIAATEMWRAKALYQDWYRVLSAYGNGVWVGGGFADQTTFGFGRPLPEYRKAASRSDGFLVVRGSVEGVRLLGATRGPARGGDA